MKNLTDFIRLQRNTGPEVFYKLCKSFLLRKEEFSKICIQKAQQYIDNYKPKKSIARTIDS